MKKYLILITILIIGFSLGRILSEVGWSVLSGLFLFWTGMIYQYYLVKFNIGLKK